MPGKECRALGRQPILRVWETGGNQVEDFLALGCLAAPPVWAAPVSQTSPAQCKLPSPPQQTGQLLKWALAGLGWPPTPVAPNP